MFLVVVQLWMEDFASAFFFLVPITLMKVKNVRKIIWYFLELFFFCLIDRCNRL